MRLIWAMSTILLVEDEDAHAALVDEAVHELDSSINVSRVRGVDEAIEFLTKSADYEAVPEPDLILLELNLAYRSGYDVLAAVCGTPSLKHIPVIVFGTADTILDRKTSLSLGAVAHIRKPADYFGYLDALRKIVGMIPRAA
jgi:chemotaxis family two-component system response regulator Rcp1